MNQRAIDLSVMARGQLAWIGPGVHSLTTSELLSWMTIAAREARALRDLDPGRRLIRVNDLERSCPTVAGRCCIPRTTVRAGEIALAAERQPSSRAWRDGACVTSTEDAGTTFTVRLPRTTPASIHEVSLPVGDDFIAEKCPPLVHKIEA